MNSEKIVEALAEKVMGWHKEGHSLSGPYWAAPGMVRERSAWNPWVDLRDAIEVIDKVAGNGGYYRLGRSGPEFLGDIPDDSQPLAFTCEVNPGSGLSNAFSRSLPQAICLCALRASGISEENIQSLAA